MAIGKLKNYRQYNPWEGFYLSFFSRDFYRDVGQNWKGSGLGYFFFLWALCSIFTTLQLDAKARKFVELEQKGQLASVPSITIKNGIVQVDAKSTVYIPNPQDPYAIVDASGSMTDLRTSKATLLLTRDHLLFRQTGLKTRSLSLSPIDDVAITPQVLKEWADILKQGWVWALYPIQVVGGFLFEIFPLLVYGIIGLIFAFFLKLPLGFTECMRLSALSHSPVFILFSWTGFIFSSFSSYYFVAFVLNCCFLYFAIESNRLNDTGSGSSMITES